MGGCSGFFTPFLHGLNFMRSLKISTFSQNQQWFETEVRVRYADTDQMGVVYYANYLIWFEMGRVELCRQKGLNYRELEKQSQHFLAVAEAECRYHSPAHYDDLILIKTRIELLRKRTISFLYQISRPSDNTLIASGRTVHVLIDRNGRPVSLTTEFSARLGE
jgi:acyl-CoA thioester hydrolase